MVDNTHIEPVPPFYLRAGFVLTLLFVVGPLALPLVWMTPTLSRWTKAFITLLMGLFTVVMVRAWLDMAPIVEQLMESQAL
ncbi:hypothetical protein V9N52_004137 [Vibrio navarrensis]